MADKKTSDKEFLEFIVTNLVDHPEDVKVERTVDEMGVLLSLRVHAEDIIRSLVRIVGLKNHARVNLKIEEPEGGRAVRKEEKPSQDSQGEELEDLKL